MRIKEIRNLAALFGVILFSLASSEGPDSDTSQDEEKKPDEGLFNPSKANEKAPEKFRVKFETTKGDVTIECTRAWSPNGVDRFYNLVEIGYFEDIGIFRVVPNFVIQFGLHGNPRVNAAWSNAKIPDDEVKETNARGTLTFATSGPNTRTTQLFINTKTGGNDRLDRMGFSPIGKVIKGIDVVDKIQSEYGERPNQGRIKNEGNKYLRESFPNLDYIKKGTILKGD